MKHITLPGSDRIQPVRLDEPKLCGGDFYRKNAPPIPIKLRVNDMTRNKHYLPKGYLPKTRILGIPRQQVTWTKEIVTMLFTLWDEGLTSGSIAGQFNRLFPQENSIPFTRNCVIAKRNRILAGRARNYHDKQI